MSSFKSNFPGNIRNLLLIIPTCNRKRLSINPLSINPLPFAATSAKFYCWERPLYRGRRPIHFVNSILVAVEYNPVCILQIYKPLESVPPSNATVYLPAFLFSFTREATSFPSMS